MSTTNLKVARGRPRKLDRENGLAACLLLFQKYGYENVSIAELCETLNVPPTSIYSTFGNKESLFKLAYQKYVSNFFESLEDTLSKSKNASEMFRNVLEFSLEFYLVRNQKMGCLMLQGQSFCRNENLRVEILHSIERLKETLKNRFIQLESENPNELTDVLITLMNGFSLSTQTEEDEDSLYTSMEFFCSAFDC
ncbi:TetR/AcrR family transcriptional regulator [Aliiglaciecola sp. M165]|uniref:TetR/AcrR family transcriptional regulator n=1 Tax=Aliiglaciecola sp. M165 TaxID=2593649 RepID=UPI00117FF607|nr:TetR/AcrR family transcriptional regulator [Aliiglaciecola sp. M165]TRY34038.1 TetR/AcrR family transcriptional regulator [Aliiglaciecola sp. M165]